MKINKSLYGVIREDEASYIGTWVGDVCYRVRACKVYDEDGCPRIRIEGYSSKSGNWVDEDEAPEESDLGEDVTDEMMEAYLANAIMRDRWL